jgi:SNF2 family DNA or RNA helicase
VKSNGAWEKLLKKYKPQGLIVDEAHRCKDRNSANFKAISKFRNVEFRLYLTGTPAPNKPWDVWAILHLIRPHNYTSYWGFIHEFFEEETLYVGGREIHQPVKFRPGMQEFLQKSLDVISIMRKRKEVMTWLPEMELPVQIKLPCTELQAKYIKELETTFETEHVNTQSILEQLIRIRQICGAPAMLNLKGDSPKITWLKQYIADYPEKSIIVFSNSKRLVYLVKAYVRCVVITGDTPPKERQQHIVSFQNGTTRVIILQTQAGKEGLTLDKADVTIFLDTYPPAADYLQAKDRMVPTRPDRVKPQEIIHLMMKGTYDEHLYKLVAKGVSDTDVINDYIKYVERRKHNG